MYIYTKYDQESRLIVCFGFFCPTGEFFTHMETSPLPVKGCKFLPLFGTYEQ